MTWPDISSSVRKTGRCCLAKLRWFDAGCELKPGWTGEPARRSSADLSADFFAPVFQSLFYKGHELVGHRAIDDAMVVTQREVNDGTNCDGICTVFVGDHEGLLGDTADAHDGDVRLVDDGQAKYGAELAGIGDGEGCAFDVGRHELLGTSAFAQVGDTALQSEEVEFVGILEDGNDES